MRATGGKPGRCERLGAAVGGKVILKSGVGVASDVRPRATLGGAIFFSRWLQLPLYLGLIVAQAVYVVRFLLDLWELTFHFSQFDEAGIMLAVLGLVDVVMIANLLIMVIIGGYETFVSRIRLDNHPDQPEWLSHVNANVLKVKLAMAIVGISSIHLLATFIEAGERNGPTGDVMMWQTLIHLTFVVSAVALAIIDRIQTPRGKRESGSAEPASRGPSPEPVTADVR